MKGNPRTNYAIDPSSGNNGTVVKCSMEQTGRVERLDPEQARRILREEMPQRIERLRKEFRDLYLRERGRARREEWEQQAA